MTERYLERKAAGLCPVCGSPSSETSVLCEPHRTANAARVRKHQRRLRAERRARQRCIDCGKRTKRYRCLGCALENKLGGALAPAH